MTKTVSIPCPQGLVGHGGHITNVILREPSYDDYLRLGDPIQLVYLGDGRHTYSENEGTIRDYIRACLVEPKDPLLLEAGGLKLARALKVAVLDFFREDAAATEPSKTSPSTSSGDAGKGGSAQAT